MRITIDSLQITVERDDGQVLKVDLSNDGLTATTDTLVLQVDEVGEMTLTVPFREAEA
jgi:hypothetical protein